MGLVIVPLASLGMGLAPSLQLSAVGLTAQGCLYGVPVPLCLLGVAGQGGGQDMVPRKADS